jgi:ubiquinone/menaquinone biosynthesis C-methylase UbiE
MPDVYATIADAESTVQERLADVLELRAADPAQQAMLDAYLADLPLDGGARVLEIGCGTGAVSRRLAPRAGSVVGMDPSPVFVERARRLAAGLDGVSFVQGDGRSAPFEDASFDAVVCHTVLCHVPGPERVLAEARRLTVPGGRLAVFDGDYATTTVALSDHDPLQTCVEAMMASSVNDRWIARRLPQLARAAGFVIAGFRSHGFIDTEGCYMLTIVDRGADMLSASGRIGEAAAASLKAEARRRVEAGTFFGHIAYASLVACKPP